MFVAEKEKFNWSMLDVLAKEFREAVASDFGEKRKWIAGSIAAVLYLRLTKGELDKLISLIVRADAIPADMPKLLEGTRSEMPPHVRSSSLAESPPPGLAAPEAKPPAQLSAAERRKRSGKSK